MTNRQIILAESMRLMRAGVLAGSGVIASVTDENGEEKRIELPEAIHTFAAWKEQGFCVKRGEHAIAAFPVWKYAERRAESSAESSAENQQQSRMFLKKAFFFKRSQVERITK